MERISNEQKAKEIAKNIVGNNHYSYFDDFKQCALVAMEWKEQQLIDKCKEFCDRQTTGEYYNRREVFQIDKYIDDMLNFIKGE